MKTLTILNLIIVSVSFMFFMNTGNKVSKEVAVHFEKNMEMQLDEIAHIDARIKNVMENAEASQKVASLSADKASAYLKNATKGLPLMKTQSGFVHLNKDEIPELVEVEGCAGKRGVFNKLVEFESEFSVAPEIILSLESFDFWRGHDHRFKTEIRNVTTKGFEMDAFTWCDTKTSMLKIKWLAIGVN